MDSSNVILEAIRSAIAELEELEHSEDWFSSSALERLYEAEKLLGGTDEDPIS